MEDILVYNMLITTLFLFFLLSTLSLLVFLLMRRPACLSCCREPFDLTASPEEGADVHQGINTYLTETQGVVVKKCLSDSPPPYESPPDYHSLPPEVLVSARGLTGLDPSPQDGITAIHTGDHQPRISSKNSKPRPPPRKERLRVLASRSSNFLSSAAPLLPSAKTFHPSPPLSPALCSSGGILSLSSCKPSTTPEGAQEYVPPPPPYECVVQQQQQQQRRAAAKDERIKGP